MRKRAVFLGCCVTYGLRASYPDRMWPDLVAQNFGFECINKGIGATTIQSTLQRQVDEFDGPVKGNALDTFHDRVKHQRPDYLFIQYGLNDLRLNDPNFTLKTFMQSVINLMRLSLSTLPRESIFLGFPQYIPESTYSLYPPWNAGSVEKHKAYTEVMAFVAKRYNVSFIDLYQEMHQYPDSEIISEGGFHPNDKGHEVIADAFIRVIKNSEAKS